MGKSAAETVKEIEGIRERLEADMRELQDRLPAPALWAKRAVGIAVGGGVAGGALMFLLRRMRRGKKKASEAPAPAVIRVVPEGGAVVTGEGAAGGRWKPLAAVVAATWLAFRVAELRELRRIRGEGGGV